ncbi:CPBP family intramembrane glutamic endopeptidase [Massilia sp. DWR3-1-1]|uniref:CPBP family intramembrane glutamic endopeptidase n=1 Tax=Massilia sp. DWR3-1-1 TaxID=2804559 RepID=UPI003CF4896B
MSRVSLDELPAAPNLPSLSTSRARRIFFSAPVRIVLGVLAIGLTAALGYAAIKAIAPLPAQRLVWPHLLMSALLLLVYVGFVKAMERRPLTELARGGAPAEFGVGVWLGAGAVSAAMALLAASGGYRIVAFHPWTVGIASALAEMLFVGLFEEILFRALIFRIVERSLGSVPALLLSAVLFALAHLGEGINALGLVNTALAGLMFSAAWMLTRRLWLCVGIHAAWNFTLGSIFSIVVSGHPAKGLIGGELSGPDWLTGGAYGLEASVVTALVIGALFMGLFWRARAAGQVLPARWGQRAIQ